MTVHGQGGDGLVLDVLKCFVTWTAFSALPELIRQMACHMSVPVKREGQPPEDFLRSGQALERTLLMVAMPGPVAAAICLVDCCKSRRERIWLV